MIVACYRLQNRTTITPRNIIILVQLFMWVKSYPTFVLLINSRYRVKLLKFFPKEVLQMRAIINHQKSISLSWLNCLLSVRTFWKIYIGNNDTLCRLIFFCYNNNIINKMFPFGLFKWPLPSLVVWIIRSG